MPTQNETSVVTWVSATGAKTITSGNCQLLGFMCAASATQGNVQFFAGVSVSASISPIIQILTTGAFVRFPVQVSGAGLTIQYAGSLDPNLMIFWLPVGGP